MNFERIWSGLAVRLLLAIFVLLPMLVAASWVAHRVRLMVLAKTGWHPRGWYAAWLWNRVLVLAVFACEVVFLVVVASLFGGRRLW